MELTRKQEEGLREAVHRFRAGEKYTCIAGYAGTGKSTLVRFIVEALGVNVDEDVCYVAFTGKAATVLKQKGCSNAITAHKLLYTARPKPDGTFIFVPNDCLEYKVVIVDEVSMLPKTMWDLLVKHDVYIIAMGDPGQLPPIDKNEDNHILDHPHVFLDEIMRQAQDSEIIRLSMWIREGKPMFTFPCQKEQVQIIHPSGVVYGMYEWADQVICATNAKRNQINNYMRLSKGFGTEPQKGDKIISLHNHWQCASAKGDWALTNGCIGTIKEMLVMDLQPPFYISEDPVKYMFTTVGLEDEDYFHQIPVDYNAILTGEPSLTPQQQFKMRKNPYSPPPPYEFSYAYAITGHKSQGSEWDKVLFFEERFPFSKEDHMRWLYTVATRAREKLVAIAQGG